MDNVVDVIFEFDAALDAAVGLYLDSRAAMVQFSKFIAQTQVSSAERLGIGIDELDKLPFTYGHGDPKDAQSIAIHSATQGDIKTRNADGGRNHLLLGQRFIVDLYTFWEDGYRSKIAAALNRDRSTILSDVFGDIRLMRNSIVHHLGIALPDIAKCKILNWFQPDDTIDISEHAKFHQMIVEVRKWLEAFGTEVHGASLGLLTRIAPSGHPRI
jgi:hypothetical protein